LVLKKINPLKDVIIRGGDEVYKIRREGEPDLIASSVSILDESGNVIAAFRYDKTADADGIRLWLETEAVVVADGQALG